MPRLDVVSETDTQESSGTSQLIKILSWNVETPVPFLTLPAKKLGTSATRDTPRPHHLRVLLVRHGFPTSFACRRCARVRATRTSSLRSWR